jgi:hypothetical protein
MAAHYLASAVIGAPYQADAFTRHASTLGQPWAPVVFIVMPVLVCLGLCWIIKEADHLAVRLVPTDVPVGSSDASLQRIQRVALACMGSSLVAYSAPELVRQLLFYVVLPKIKHGRLFLEDGWYMPDVLALVLQVVVGALLFLQAGGLAALRRRLQALPRVSRP